MWDYMTSRAGEHKNKFNSDITICCNVDGPKDDMSVERERAVRKVVRTIIEANGGNGCRVKKDI